MALNRNHSQNGGVLINNGESIVRECKSVELQLSDVKTKADLLKGSKKGNVYLTPYRLVFVSTNAKDHVVSAMFPYHLMKGCSIEQPVFGANYIKGNVLAEYGGGWEGTAQFKMTFMSGGAIDFGQYLFKLATNGKFLKSYVRLYTLLSLLFIHLYYFQPLVHLQLRTGLLHMAAEAAASAYYDPSNPHTVYMPMVSGAARGDVAHQTVTFITDEYFTGATTSICTKLSRKETKLKDCNDLKKQST
uniref:GRAM domain-containing protein n=1 Tax=Periophthalmus magnuspinnatus TaxID=409849 RepID=A0A3B4A3Z5_9GOBI